MLIYFRDFVSAKDQEQTEEKKTKEEGDVETTTNGPACQESSTHPAENNEGSPDHKSNEAKTSETVQSANDEPSQES